MPQQAQDPSGAEESPSTSRHGWRGLLARAGVRWTLLAGGLLVFALFSEVTSGLIMDDEAWFLQVARRLVSGEVLYRDVFFGATPISAYLAAGLVRLLGVEILVIRAMMAACLVATCLLSLHIARQLRLSGTSQALIVLAILAFVPAWLPGAGSLYTPLAYVFLLGCLSSTLAWLKRAESAAPHPGVGLTWLLFAGAFAGLAFASKQTIGAYTLVALLAAILAGPSPTKSGVWGRLRWMLAALAAFTGVAALTFVPVVLTGGSAKFLEYGFLNRGVYVRYATISYWAQLEDWVHRLTSAALLDEPLFAYWSSQYLLPAGTFIALGLAWARRERGQRDTLLSLFAFCAAAFAGVFPLVHLPHMTAAVAPLTLGLAWGIEQIWAGRQPAVWRLARALIAFGLAVGIAALVVRPVRWLALGTHSVSSLDHFHGVLLPRDRIATLLTQAEDLKVIPSSEPLFILSPSAGLLYLLADRSNPTPYDYPEVTAFGIDGQNDIIEQIDRGRIAWVCLTSQGTDDLSPSLLVSFVESHMRPYRSTAMCTLYDSSP